jgi:hypothetical protein
MPALPATGPLAGSGSSGRGSKDPFGQAVRRLPEFGSAVLTAFDEQGNPTLARVRPSADHASRSFTIDTGTPLRPGRASLLCHSHDEQLWSLRSFVVAGDLVRDGENWTLRPDRFIPGGADKLSPIAMIKIIRALQGATRRYLDRRGLSRPEIDWREIDTLTAELEPAA